MELFSSNLPSLSSVYTFWTISGGCFISYTPANFSSMKIEIKRPSAISPWKQMKYVTVKREIIMIMITPIILAYPLLPFIVPIEMTVTMKIIKE